MSNKEISGTKITPYKELFTDIVKMVSEGRNRVATEFNSTVVVLYWSIGRRINEEVLKGDRANYGDQIISHVSDELTMKFGKGYNRASLFRMVRFARIYPDQKIVATASRQLSWSHIILICQLENDLQRDFYLELARIERWSVRETRDKINSMLFERTAISKKPEEVIKAELSKLRDTNELNPDLVFRDPCFLDFINLDGKYSEGNLENAILNNITEFLHEIGNDFCFVARQKRMSTKNKDRYLDLLFFHRGLKCLVAIELKLDRFEPEHKGQMEWYLNWLDKNERKSDEGRPIGIILCADKDQEDVEYLELNDSGIHVTKYLTQLPPKKLLEQYLHKAIALARANYQEKDLIIHDKI
jgi:predicted nuclease of restriction endonuclease-like (RecB) superfamily